MSSSIRTSLSVLCAFLVVHVLVPSRAAAQGGEQAAPTSIPAWSIDRSHSRVAFSVRHFFTPVEGSFADYEIDLAFDPDAIEDGHVRVRVDAASVDTDNQRRDDDLRGNSFFEVDAHPELVFESRSVRRVSDREFIVEGDLTIRDVTRQVELTATLLGVQALEGDVSRYGRMVAGFEAHATIDRRDFGVGSGRWAETVVLGAEVTIDILLEARLQ